MSKYTCNDCWTVFDGVHVCLGYSWSERGAKPWLSQEPFETQQPDFRKEMEATLDRCPECGGPADNGNDRCDPPSAYLCKVCSEYEEGKPTQALKDLMRGDPINPPHYNELEPQPINVIEAWGLGYHLGTVVKYLSRAGRKGDRVEDLKKAAWFLQREIERVSK